MAANAGIPSALGNLLSGIGFNFSNGTLTTGGPGTVLGNVFGAGVQNVNASGGGAQGLSRARRFGLGGGGGMRLKKKPRTMNDIYMNYLQAQNPQDLGSPT